LAQCDTVLRGEPHQALAARCICLAPAGKAIAFSCTVVSTIALAKSDGLAAPVLVAVERLSCNSATSFVFAHSLAPARHRGAVEGELMPKELLAAESRSTAPKLFSRKPPSTIRPSFARG
jgi:hypothetical protein